MCLGHFRFTNGVTRFRSYNLMFIEMSNNKPGNLFSNFDILLGTSQRTIYMKFKKNH
jgi:hypothetical protein